MSDDQIIRPVRGEDLRGAARLILAYFDSRAEQGEDRMTTVGEFADVSGMAPDFTEVAHDMSKEMAVNAMSIAGAPLDDAGNLRDYQLQIDAEQLKHMLAGAYMHGIQIGALAGCGITHPDAE